MSKKSKLPKKPVYIYGLYDPRTDLLFYVGKSVNPKKRLDYHLKDKNRTHKTEKVNELKKLNLLPVMKILEVCNESNWQDREIYWIAYCKSIGLNLTNMTIGGDDPEPLKSKAKRFTKKPVTLKKRGFRKNSNQRKDQSSFKKQFK